MSATARDLARRLWLLLALGAAATAALFGAYQGVHGDAVPLSSSSAPGVLAVDTAKYALDQAQKGAQRDAPLGAAGTGDFHTQISVANQNLALAASDNVTGRGGRQTLQTVAGLITVYSGWIEKANQESSGSLLQKAYLHYAQSVLGDARTKSPGDPSVMGRLSELQREQVKVVSRQTSFGWPLWLGWSAVLVLCLSLCGALLEAQRFSRRRFRRRWNRPLAAATALLVAEVTTLGLFTWRTQTGMARSGALLRRPQSGNHIPDAQAQVAGQMAGAGFRAAAAGWILAGGALLMVLIVAGLMPRITEYRFRVSR
ncbi:MAG: hypothetical protein QOI83_4065 [Streptomycetaceae bacterium]|nr:hypothetical protein [Streptomycetaceae bacterium]